ncbi:MAG: c-type cytochrome [Gemmatimonadota bacterium]
MSWQKKKSRRRRRLIGGLLVLVVLVAGGAWNSLFRVVPVEYADDVENFKHGTIGIEESAGIPYWVWLVLPRVFPEHLPGPGGYTSLGMVWEEGSELPVGFSKMEVGFPRVGANCSFCHTGTYRTAPDAPRQVVPGGPSTTADTQGYLRFLIAAANDPRFTADNLMPEIEYLVRLSPAERSLYRNVLIPQTRRGILETARDYAWMEAQPRWGPGRIDPFNPVKVGVLRRPIDGTIGNSDMMPIWSLDERDGSDLHWDGLNGSIREVVLSSALGDGTSRSVLDLATMERLEDWLRTLRPPAYPFPIAAALAEEGRSVYQQNCTGCHGEPGNWAGRMVPVAAAGESEGLERIATDPYRVRMWDQASAETYNRYASGYDWKFEGFQDQDAYAAVPLTGIWLRAPYLHNGSVPTLWHLFRPEERPERFYRGYDVFDPLQVGFRYDVAEEGVRQFFLYDTALPGNSNAGHAYGSALPEEEKVALVEYLKTL